MEEPCATGFNNLPLEIIEYIFNDDELTYVDLCRLTCVCQMFKCVGNSNSLWQNKYRKKWPGLFNLYDAQNTSWKREFEVRFHCAKLAALKLSEMAVEFYHHDNVSNDAFLQFRDMLLEHPLSHSILINELESVIHDGNNHLNLTNKYYAKRTLRFMRHSHLQAVWRLFLSKPLSRQTLEQGACLLSQWCQPTKSSCTNDVSKQLDEIAERVLEKVREVCPTHPVLDVGVILQDEVLGISMWQASKCKIVLNCINIVMFHEMKFSGNKEEYYLEENTFIDKVLTSRKGIPITLGIIYSMVASRLGVACLSVNFPGHFFLKWLEHPQLTTLEAYTFIDVFDNGAFRASHDLHDFVPGYHDFSNSWFDAVSPLKVFIRMCWNLVEVGRQTEGVGEGLFCLCNALELLSILNPNDMEHKLLLARVYTHLCINMTEVIGLLQEIVDQDPLSTGIVSYMYQSAVTILDHQKVRKQKRELKIRIRDGTDVRYRVGMIMKHKNYNYRGVIYGWDAKCIASKDWIKQMGVYNLPNKDNQPFYQILVDDGSNRYAAQENLEEDYLEMPISHAEVGRYFESFHGKYYIPNSQKCSEYPQDVGAQDHVPRSSQNASLKVCQSASLEFS